MLYQHQELQRVKCGQQDKIFIKEIYIVQSLLYHFVNHFVNDQWDNSADANYILHEHIHGHFKLP